MLSPRNTNLVIALACAGLIAAALFLQHMLDLTPCYLCIVQRVLVIATGVIATLAFIHHPGRGGQHCYAAATGISALAGAGFALRQLWLQSLPADRVPACGPPADYLFDVFSLGEALPMLLQGDGNCAQVQWTLFNLSIPAWTLMAFAGLALLSLWQLLRKT